MKDKDTAPVLMWTVITAGIIVLLFVNLVFDDLNINYILTLAMLVMVFFLMYSLVFYHTEDKREVE